MGFSDGVLAFLVRYAITYFLVAVLFASLGFFIWPFA